MWKFEYTVECPVSRDFAWQFWTNVDNWAVVDPGVDAVTIDGPFAAGARGTTKPRSMDSVDWLLTEVEDGTSAIIEIAAPGAVAKFIWIFADAAGGTRITQQASLEGEQADQYAQTFGKGLEDGMPPGMQRLADAIEAAANAPR
ncbi:MAG: SRPBCC family protein [Blastocatellia bacterium]